MLYILLQLNKNMNQTYLVAVCTFITLFGVIIMIITLSHIIQLIHRKHLDIIRTHPISGLSQSNLSQIISSTDTAIHNIISHHNGNLGLYINGIGILDTTIIKISQHYKAIEDYEDGDALVTKHLQYLEESEHYNTHYCELDKAIVGASFEKIFSAYTRHIPHITLIHHMINYTHTIGYTNALSNILNNVVNNNSRYKLINTAVRPQIRIVYNSKKPNQFLVYAKFEKSLTIIGKKTRIYPVTTKIKFLISLPKDKSEFLQYSEGKIVLNCSHIPNKVASSAFHKTTSHKTLKHSTKLTYILPNFTIQHITSTEQTPEDPIIHKPTTASSLENSTMLH